MFMSPRLAVGLEADEVGKVVEPAKMTHGYVT
jgi:hypothetical protein